LAALLPRCVGQRWHRASRIGAVWGIGHGISVLLVGMIAFFVKGQMLSSTSSTVTSSSTLTSISKFLVSHASSITELAVGLSLIVIGLMGIKEAKEWTPDDENDIHDDSSLPKLSLSAAVTPSVSLSSNNPTTPTRQSRLQHRAVLFNGLLHGFSWDGAPSLAPALAVATWRANVTFLLAYALGTIGVMTVATTVVGEGTRKAGQVFHQLPQKLSFVSSVVAVGIGIVWCGLAIR
jgi:hypothetical protein